MAKITLKEPDGPYFTIVDTGSMDVLFEEVFLGVRFITAAGEILTVAMRDTGYELTYSDGDIVKSDISLKDGQIEYRPTNR